MNKRKLQQKAKRKAWQVADKLSAQSKQLVDSVKQVESANWFKSVKSAGSVESLSAKHRQERLTKIPKAYKKVGKLGNVKDSLPFESISNGILTVKRLSRSDGYACGLDKLGFVFCLGSWRKLHK